ncbi:MAG: Nif3-like dinuclear metal center hexameric protein [Spirochaetaceae bacterium]|jgi:dinuclear metal center YbgI/SA1388 family protein|nr:Nif3-like dinuclear metal center hexameric protein [Spirochaetaceae bacterium]
MITQKVDAWFRNFLDLEGFSAADPSLNGLQVDNDGGEVEKIAFAVDASLETFKRAAEAGAGLLFVHHGLFWGSPLRLQGGHRQRIQFLLDHNIALYAVHLPLDQHPQVGNNAVLAERLGIADPLPFGLYHGHNIGYKGILAQPLSIEEAVKRIAFMNRPPLGVYPFGPGESRTAAVVSGGASEEALEALDEGIDLYVTGELSHSVYHAALEGQLNMIAGGHYSTEVWGVRRVMERCAAELHIETEFIDVPTGL